MPARHSTHHTHQPSADADHQDAQHLARHDRDKSCAAVAAAVRVVFGDSQSP